MRIHTTVLFSLLASFGTSALGGQGAKFWELTEVEQAEMMADQIDERIECDRIELGEVAGRACHTMDTLDRLLDDTADFYGSLESAIDSGGELCDPKDEFVVILEEWFGETTDEIEGPDTPFVTHSSD